MCFQCDFGGGVAADSAFTVDNAAVDSSQGTTVMGVLVIFNTEQVLDTGSPLNLRCSSGEVSLNGLVFLRSKCIIDVYA